ncbi:ATPase associated with various cellular activities, AAA_5 [Rhodopseudomonas palustris TIE-1]|uniref:hypothetical protein n=1 Tax=Rhodopseudomonas palustris TaxID=1076 RepID=UPI000164B0DC|nr:hypothetical protein [Rhodopseudomonas palustris]ACF00046.1 ATPase associated with various cellular activities, AAA_5 [Rhodopseudomonas palustris TIE-1]
MAAEFDDDDTLATITVSEREAASTGAAADTAEADAGLKALPRILRIALLPGRTDSYVRERLIGEIAELCPNLPETAIWANARTTDAAINLAAELDRQAAADDRSDLRSLADCVRLISLPVPHSEVLLAEHRRVGKSLLMASTTLPEELDVDVAAEIEALVWGWAALPNARRVADRMARQRIEQAIETVREQYNERDRKEREKQGGSEEKALIESDGDFTPGGHLIVCALDDASLKSPKLKEIVAPLKAVINKALPIVAAPPLHDARQNSLRIPLRTGRHRLLHD